MRGSTGVAIILSLSATDPEGDPMVFTTTGLSPDLALHSQTGRISAALSPASVGTHEVTVTVADTTSASSQTFAWTVEE